MARFELVQLEERFARQAHRLQDVVRIQQASSELRVETAEYGLVALQDAWSRFVRDLIIRSTLGNAVTALGRRVGAGPYGVIRQTDALTVLRTTWRATAQPPWWEPYWYRIQDAATAVRLLGPSNGADIIAAIGSSSNPVDDLRWVRNFAVHRLPSTASEAARVATSYSVMSWQQPADLIASPAPGGAAGESIFDHWCRLFTVVAHAAVQ